MKKLLSILLTLMLSVAVAFSFAACSKDEAKEDSSAKSDVEQESDADEMCEECGENEAVEDGLCEDCLEAVEGEMCKECGENEAVEDGLCEDCMEADDVEMCILCDENEAVEDGFCKDCAKEINSISDTTEVEAYVEEHGQEMIDGFAEGAGLDGEYFVEAEGNDIVMSFWLKDANDVPEEAKTQMQATFDSMKEDLKAQFAPAKVEIPSLEAIVVKICEEDGDLMASIEVELD